jgi:hypothetical protein
MIRRTRLTEGESRGEVSKGLDIACPIALKEDFEIMLNLEIESVLFLSIVIIVQLILLSDYVTVQNQFRLKISVRPRDWRFWRGHTSELSLRGFWAILWKKVGSNPHSGPTCRTDISEGRNVFTTY